MALVNEHFLKLPNNYLFADIAKKVNAFKVMNPKANVISLGIGDVTQPLCPAVIEAMHCATDEMATRQGFRGYGPELGYDFLREAILKNDFLPRGIHLDIDEIFVNDGAKSDTGNIQELIRWDNSIGVTDPIYPVYIDSNVMIGRAGTVEDGKWSNVVYLPCNAENGFVPQVPGGVGELMKFLSETVKYPEAAEKAGKQGRVIAAFVVEKDGTVSGAKVVKSVSPELDAEALRVINAMPNWKPGMQSGKAVRVKYTIPITCY